MVWELYQQSQINSATRAASEANRKAQRSADDSKRALEALKEKVNILELTCLALFEILQDKCDVTLEELTDKVEEIDLRDGKQDRQITPAEKVCEACSRKSTNGRTKCLYCGGKCVDE